MEAGEITDGRDPSGHISIEKTLRDRAGTINNEFEARRVDVSLVDRGDGVEIALLKADRFSFTDSSTFMRMLAGKASCEAGAEHNDK